MAMAPFPGAGDICTAWSIRSDRSPETVYITSQSRGSDGKPKSPESPPPTEKAVVLLGQSAFLSEGLARGSYGDEGMGSSSQMLPAGQQRDLLFLCPD